MVDMSASVVYVSQVANRRHQSTRPLHRRANPVRIVTRPDFDGIVCAVLLYEALDIQKPVYWVEPGELQKGRISIAAGDIIANLPYHPNCRMWFDHHISNKPTGEFEGAFSLAPSAARVIYDYFKDLIKGDFSELVAAADKIDSADLSEEEVLHPEKYSYVLLSMTVTGQDSAGGSFWDHLVDLFRMHDIDTVCKDPMVAERCSIAVEQNRRYREILNAHTELQGPVSVSDFRDLDPTPMGNRFLVYCLFPEAVVNVKIRYDDMDRDKVIVSAGHNIFNPHCRVNVGEMMSHFDGGGHRGAGACNFHKSQTDRYIPEILKILRKNEPLDRDFRV